MIIIRTIWFYLNAVTCSFVMGSLMAITSPFDSKRRLQNGLLKIWGKWIFAASGVRIRCDIIKDLDTSRPYIVTANHESMMDIFIIIASSPVPLRMVSKKEIGRLPFIGWLMKLTGFVFVDREKSSKSFKHLNEGIEKLKKNGVSLMLFPEGSRYKTRPIGDFKRGAFRMAIEYQLPILPIVLKGVGHILPPGKRLIRKGKVHLSVMEAIETSHLNLEDRQTLMANCRKKMSEHYQTLSDDIPEPDFSNHIKEQ